MILQGIVLGGRSQAKKSHAMFCLWSVNTLLLLSADALAHVGFE